MSRTRVPAGYWYERHPTHRLIAFRAADEVYRVPFRSLAELGDQLFAMGVELDQAAYLLDAAERCIEDDNRYDSGRDAHGGHEPRLASRSAQAAPGRLTLAGRVLVGAVLLAAGVLLFCEGVGLRLVIETATAWLEARL